MWYSKQLRQVRRARQAARAQQHQLLEMELEGIVAITLLAVTQSLTVAPEREVGVQVVEALREALRDRRQVLKTEARQLRQDWQGSETLRARKAPLSQPFAAPLPVAALDADPGARYPMAHPFPGGLRWCEVRPGNTGPSASSLEPLVGAAPPPPRRRLQLVNSSQYPPRDTRLTTFHA